MKSKNHTNSTSKLINFVMVWTVFAGLMTAGLGTAQAKEPRSHAIKRQVCDGDVGGTGGGGELPSPFDTANRRVELADGEAYLLAGRVVLSQALSYSGEKKLMPFFRVDLNEHPWLATEKRINRPIYPLEGTVEDWKEYVSAGKIKLPCIAHGVLKSDGTHIEYMIQLQLSSELPVEPMNR